MSHTQGPWRWVTVDYGENLWIYNIIEDGPFDALWSDSENKPVFVAQDASSYRATCDFPVQENATLIAAAPELLEALENIENDDGRIPSTLWDLRNRAIAKARGEP